MGGTLADNTNYTLAIPPLEKALRLHAGIKKKMGTYMRAQALCFLTLFYCLGDLCARANIVLLSNALLLFRGPICARKHCAL